MSIDDSVVSHRQAPSLRARLQQLAMSHCRWFALLLWILAAGCSQGAEGSPCTPATDAGGGNECTNGLTCQRPAKCTNYYCCPTPASMSSNSFCNSSACTAS